MDVAADATAWPPGWSLVRGYFSPVTLFLLLNMVIGTIALTSRASHRRRHHHHNEHYKAQHHHDHHDHHEPQRCHDQYAPPPPAPLERTSSVMERLRSLGLYRFRSGDFPPEYNLSAATNTICDGSEEQQAQYTRSRSEPPARPAPSPVEQRGKAEAEKSTYGAVRAKAVKKSSSEVRKLERAPAQARQVQVQRAPPPLPGAPAPERAVQAAAREEETAEVGLATASSVDARADDFINKFREQLQLQRLNSLLNYKEMLNRGT